MDHAMQQQISPLRTIEGNKNISKRKEAIEFRADFSSDCRE
jgi:hypothetical protein